VQGRLRREYLSIEVETQCAQSGRPLRFTIDSDMRVNGRESEAKPLVFMPDVDWNTFAEPTIIDAY